MAFIDIADQKIFYSLNTSEADYVIVAIHGSGGDHTNWPINLRDMPQARVYALDLPGHGQSSGDGHDRMEAYADFIEAFTAQLDLNKVTLIGHSLGGAIALSLALRSPRWLSSIVLVGTGARLKVHPDILEGILSNFETTIDMVCQWVFGPAASDTLINETRKVMLNTRPEVVHGDFRACNRFDIMDSISSISLPTLVISGSVDNLTPVKYGDYLCQNIPAAKHRIIQDAGHMMAVEKPENFIQIVTDFMGQ